MLFFPGDESQDERDLTLLITVLLQDYPEHIHELASLSGYWKLYSLIRYPPTTMEDLVFQYAKMQRTAFLLLHSTRTIPYALLLLIWIAALFDGWDLGWRNAFSCSEAHDLWWIRSLFPTPVTPTQTSDENEDSPPSSSELVAITADESVDG